MTQTPIRRPLPMLGETRGKRSPVTCHLKCDDACSKPVPNTSDNEYFRDIAAIALSRRTMLRSAGVGALALVVGGQLAGAPDAAAGTAVATQASPTTGNAGARVGFSPIDPVPADVDMFTVPDGYDWKPVIRWGDPLFDADEIFDVENQSAARQERQFGYNNDYTDVIEIPGTRGLEALLVCNHEYTNNNIMSPPTTDSAELNEQRRISQAAHGMAVVHVHRERRGNPWEYTVGSRYNRRYTANTPFAVAGYLAGTDVLKTTADRAGKTILGTIGNCSGGTTPWGTVLSGEENFNGYFRTAARSTAAPQLARYGLDDKPSAYGWENIQDRFDARGAGYENEPNRFGWIVEIDPFEPKSTPVKHTALGRFKHEGANVIVGKSRHVAAYMGDDERFDYLYKFVSKNKMRTGTGKSDRAHNKQLLAEGSLYVAKFSGDSPQPEIDRFSEEGVLPSDGAFDGSGHWLPIVINGVSQVRGFSTEQALVYCRLAADALGATKMDRCEDVEPSLRTGKIYVACTNNTDRGKVGKQGATEPNPRNANRDGHIVEITEDRNDVRSTTFRWSLLLVCGDPAQNERTYFAGFPRDEVSPISCPDNVAFDSRGDLWISTDGAPGVIGYNDGLFKIPLNGRERGHVQQFLSVPREAETCGPVIHDREGLVFVAVQHPGEDGSFAEPSSLFPDYLEPGETLPGSWRGPRPSVVQVFLKKI